MAPVGISRRSIARKRGERKLFTKKTFGTNQHTTNSSATNTASECPSSSNDSGCNTSTMSASARKMETSLTANEASFLEDKDELQNHLGSHYILMDTEILKTIIGCIGVCPLENCMGKITFKNLIKEKCGLSCKLVFNCEVCNWTQYFYTSKELPRESQAGRKPFDVNLRTVAAFREIGKGHSAIETVCGFMNLSRPMNINAYKKSETILYDKYKKVAHDDMKNVTQEIREKQLGKKFSEDEVVDIDASFDGTWQKRGHSSLNGIVSAISRDTGKCFDYRVMSKKLQWVSYMER